MKIQILGRTGPKSSKGKAISALNAVKHGGYAKTKILPFEDASERNRLERELIRALKPSDAIEREFVDRMVESYWSCARFELRLALRQENIFKDLSLRALAQTIKVPENYQPFAPEYLKDANTEFNPKELEPLRQQYRDYLHLIKNSKGIQNYQMVFGAYKNLFLGFHEFVRGRYAEPFLNHDQTGLNIAWQQVPQQLEEELLRYAAHLYYQLNFDTLRPAIRIAMSNWFFLQRSGQHERDLQDEMVLKEIQRYQHCLNQLMKYRKIREATGLPRLGNVSKATVKEAKTNRNEIADSANESTT